MTKWGSDLSCCNEIPLTGVKKLLSFKNKSAILAQFSFLIDVGNVHKLNLNVWLARIFVFVNNGYLLQIFSTGIYSNSIYLLPY